MTILEAVNDLDDDRVQVLRDDENKVVHDRRGKKIYFTVKEEAYNFLSGKTKSLYYICKAIGLNASAITQSLKRYGAEGLKRTFLGVLHERDKYVTN